ncbi:MAG: alpha/beta hydrolase [Rhodothermales bacterium]|nr:alpha/beta hydrolase [Rhodothermales bacterium]
MAIGQGRCEQAAQVHICKHQAVGPTLVLAAGAGQDSRTWDTVLDSLVVLGSVVTFDRPGLGRSPLVQGPRTPTVIALELREALSSLDVSGPLVLIGHSMGGVHMLRFADLFPDDVAAVVLIDTPPPSFEEDRLSLLTPEEQERRAEALAAGRSRAPVVVGLERDGARSEPWAFEGLRPDLPVTVVVADSQDFGDLGSLQAHRDLWMERSSQWLKLTDKTELVVAHGSGHMVHREQPELIARIVAGIVADLD